MVLSNAERQKRYREKLKAAARGEAVVEQVRAAIQAAFLAIWRDGAGYYGPDDEPTEADAWIRDMVHAPESVKREGLPVAQLHRMFRDELRDADAGDGELSDEGRAAIEHAIAIIDAAGLKPPA